MTENSASMKSIHALEENIKKQSSERLVDLLAYFEFIQETLIIAFNNDGKPLPLKDVPNNPKLFVYISTTRFFSISKIAMDITLRGYPMEGMALTRTLIELLQCTQYLVRHPDSIDKYQQGSIKLDKVIKMAKHEIEDLESSFGRYWGLLTRYAHPSPDSLALQLQPTSQNGFRINLVISDSKKIDDVAYGIMVALLTQYLTFRWVIQSDFSVNDELKKRDQFIFDPKNIRKFAGFDRASDQDLEQLHSFLNSEID